MRPASFAAALLLASTLGACSPMVESRSADSPQPLDITGQSDATFEGVPAASLEVELSRLGHETVSLDATMTNNTSVYFSTSAGELLYVSADGHELYGVGREAFGGDPLAPGEMRSWHLELEAPSDGVITIIASNWFVPRPEPGDEAMDMGSIEVTAPLSELPAAP